jgi:hypothetical protein
VLALDNNLTLVSLSAIGVVTPSRRWENGFSENGE